MVPTAPAAPTESRSSGRPFTRADLAAMPGDGRRYELIDGVLIVNAPPGVVHQHVVDQLCRRLGDACPVGYEVVVGPFPVALADDTEIQPDLLVARQVDLTDDVLPSTPMLAVEVLTPSTRQIDLHLKWDRLRRAGAEAYWVIDPGAQPEPLGPRGAPIAPELPDPAGPAGQPGCRTDQVRLTGWELSAGTGDYRLVADVVGDEPFDATVPFPVRVVPAELLRWSPVT